MAKKPSNGKGLEEFRKNHDKNYIIPRKIQDGLDELGAAWEYEAEFIRRCGLSHTDFAMFRDEFIDHVVTTTGKNPKRAWCGTAEFAEELRNL